MPPATSRPSALPPRIGIRGRGRAGKALARALSAAGVSPVWISRKGGRAPSVPFDVVFLAVPDDAIGAESRRLVDRGIRARCVLHLSGALAAAPALAAWRRKGSAIASFHPLGSFSGRRSDSAGGRTVAIEGDAAGSAAAARIARAIGGRPWRLSAAAKPIYHAAATAAAGGAATLVAEAARAAERVGMPSRDALPAFSRLAREAVENVARAGFPAGLTGPLARGDAGTLRLHRRALAGKGGLADAYAALARAARAAILRENAAGPLPRKRSAGRKDPPRPLGV